MVWWSWRHAEEVVSGSWWVHAELRACLPRPFFSSTSPAISFGHTTMDDVTLDYGEPHETGTVGEQTGTGEEGLDAEMQDWADGYEGAMDQFEEKREEKLQELKKERSGAKFYPLPREEGVAAGANRGVTSHSPLAEDDMLGPEGERLCG